MKKTKVESAQEQYFREKLERSASRRENAKEVFKTIGLVVAMFSGIIMLALIIVSLLGGWQYFSKQDDLSRDIVSLKRRVEWLEQQTTAPNPTLEGRIRILEEKSKFNQWWNIPLPDVFTNSVIPCVATNNLFYGNIVITNSIWNRK